MCGSYKNYKICRGEKTKMKLLTPMNLTFTVLMLVLFMISLWKIRRNPKESSTIPNSIAVLGIIGTFVGIFYGLLKFDTTKLDSSIPVLLDGMKTAFFTSILGLGFSSILKSVQSNRVKKVIKEENIGETSLEKITNLMFGIKESITNSNRELISSIEILREELVGNKETSLVEQMKSLKDDMRKTQIEAQECLNLGLQSMEQQLGKLVQTNEAIGVEIERGNNILIDEFRVFAKNMAENNMKAFTEAIQECIRDLNNQLQEQFGENFKHLNRAVERLLEWQEHYKETVEKTNENQVEIYKGMLQAKELVVEISERSYSIVEITNRLGDKIVTFDTQQKSLNNSIEILNKISMEARELLPNLDKYSSEFNESIISIANRTQNYFEELTKFSTENIRKQQEGIVETLKEVTTTIKTTSELNIQMMEAQIESINKAFVKFENEGFTLTKKISDNIQTMVKNNNSNLETSVKNLNTALENTLNVSLQSLGEQLAAVSEKFVNDYTPLTIELQKVVNLAKKVGETK